MLLFHYTALTKDGKTIRQQCEADSLKQACQNLRARNLTVLDIKIDKHPAKNQGQVWWKLTKKRMSTTEQAFMTRQLSVLLAAGISLEEALSSLAEQSENARIKSVIVGLRGHILAGLSLSSALMEYKPLFSYLYCATVGAGEKTGRLEKVLTMLADFIERRQQIRQQILQAAIYPSIVALTALGIVGFLVAYVVPKLVAVFVLSDQLLPLPTRLLLSVSHGVQAAGIYMLLALLASIAIFKRALHNPRVRRRWDSLLLRLPLIGRTIRLTNTARFAHTFAMLNQAGVEILEAMRVGSETVDNTLISDSLAEATRQVREGVTIHRALQKTGYFPPLSLQLIASGENSGQLGPMLERAAFTQETTIQARISLLLTLFEPAVILLMGSVVLFIVLAILLPILNLEQLNG